MANRCPFSLRDQCFLYVVGHLEEFPPETLALLPVKTRLKLLLKLPAIDICALEETAVVSGLDQNHIWQTICSERIETEFSCILPDAQNTLEDLGVRFGSKEYYFTLLSHIVFKGYPFSPRMCLQQLLCIPSECISSCFPEHISWGLSKVGQSSYNSTFFLVPERYMPEYNMPSEHDNPPHTISLLLKQLHFHLPVLHLEIRNLNGKVVGSFPYMDPEVLHSFVSHIEILLLVQVESITPIPGSTAKFENINLLETVLPSCKNRLKVLHIDGEFTTTDIILHSVVKKGIQDLRELVFNAYCDENRQTAYGLGKTAETNLALLITESTGTLQTLRITLAPPNEQQCQNELAQALCTAISQPHLVSITLGQIHVGIGHALELLLRFLLDSTPHERELILQEVLISEDGGGVMSPPPLIIFELKSAQLLTKSLVLHSMYLPDDLVATICNLPQLHLKLLHFDQVTSNSKLLCMLNSNPGFAVEKVVLESLHSDVYTPGDIKHLMGNPALKHLELCDFNLPVDDITLGLLAQSSIGQLKELSLMSCGLGSRSDLELWLFFCALFNLPQLEMLDVRLHYNRLKPNHLEMMYEVWKAATSTTAKKLKLLHLVGDRLSLEMFPLVTETAKELRIQRM